MSITIWILKSNLPYLLQTILWPSHLWKDLWKHPLIYFFYFFQNIYEISSFKIWLKPWFEFFLDRPHLSLIHSRSPAHPPGPISVFHACFPSIRSEARRSPLPCHDSNLLVYRRQEKECLCHPTWPLEIASMLPVMTPALPTSALAASVMYALAQPLGDATAPEHPPEPPHCYKRSTQLPTPSHNSSSLSTSLPGVEALPSSPSQRRARARSRFSGNRKKRWRLPCPLPLYLLHPIRFPLGFSTFSLHKVDQKRHRWATPGSSTRGGRDRAAPEIDVTGPGATAGRLQAARDPPPPSRPLAVDHRCL
jgi:hypothetical protein